MSKPTPPEEQDALTRIETRLQSLEEKLANKAKDFWDKASTAGQILGTVVIAAIALHPSRDRSTERAASPKTRLDCKVQGIAQSINGLVS